MATNNIEQNRRKLYDAVAPRIGDIGTWNEFNNKLNDESNRRKLYDALSPRIGDIGTWDEFNARIYQAPEPEQSTQLVRQVQQQTPAPTTTPQPVQQQAAPQQVATPQSTTPAAPKFKAGDTFTWNGYNFRLNGFDEDGKAKVLLDGELMERFMTVEQLNEGQPFTAWTPTWQQRAAMQQQVDRSVREFEAGTEAGQQRLRNVIDYNNSAAGLQGKPMKGRMVLNPVTGKIEQTFITPYGDETTDENVAERAAQEFRAEQFAVSLPGRIVSTHERIAQLREAIEKRTGELAKAAAERDSERGVLDRIVGGIASGEGGYVDDGGYAESLKTDRELNVLRLSLRQAQESLQHLENVRGQQERDSEGSRFWGNPLLKVAAGINPMAGLLSTAAEIAGDDFVEDFAKGTMQAIGDSRAWDFGYGDLRDAVAMHSIASKIEAKQELTEAERDAMMDLATNQAVMSQFGDLGRGYRWGDIAGTSLSFMKDFMLTGAFGGLSGVTARGATALGTRIASNLTTRAATGLAKREVLSRVLERGLLQFVKNEGMAGVGALLKEQSIPWVVKAIGTTADDLLVRAPLMVNTVQGMSTMANVLENKVGRASYNPETGQFLFKDGTTWSNAAWQAEADQIIEDFSEMWGAHLPGLAEATRALGARDLTAAILRSTREGAGTVISKASNFLKRAGVDGYFGEVGEEYYGQAWRTWLGLDSAYDENGQNLFKSGQFHGDIWGGMALSVGLTGGGAMVVNSGLKYGGKAVDYFALRNAVNRTDRRAGNVLTSDVWDPMRTVIDATDNANIGELAEQVWNDGTMTAEQKGAVLDYMEASMVMRGHNLREFVSQQSEEEHQGRTAMADAYVEGMNIESAEDRNRARMSLNYEAEHLREVLNVAEDASIPQMLSAMYGTDDINTIVTALYEDKTVGEAERSAIVDYLKASNRYNGMMQAVEARIKADVEEQEAFIEDNSDHSDKENPVIRPAILKLDNEQVFIIGGNVQMLPDGSMVDTANSDKAIFIRRLDGSLDTIDAADILNIAEPESTASAKKHMGDETRDRVMSEYMAEINGTIAANPGDIVPVQVGEDIIEVKVEQNDGSNVAVTMPDGSQSVVPLAQIQDIANRQAESAYRAEIEASKTTEQPSEDSEPIIENEDEVAGGENVSDESGLTLPRDKGLFPEEYEAPYSGQRLTASRYIENGDYNGMVYVNPETGMPDVVVAAVDDNSYVGYFREYDSNGNPTNEWSAKFENHSGDRRVHAGLMQTAAQLLPAGHELTEHTSVSTDGLRNLANQLRHGYAMQTNGDGTVKGRWVAVNAASRNNDLGFDYSEREFENVHVTEEQFARAKRNLAPFMLELGLDPDAAIRMSTQEDGRRVIEVFHPTLISTREEGAEQENGPDVPATKTGFELNDDLVFGEGTDRRLEGAHGRIVSIDRSDPTEPQYVVEYTTPNGDTRVMYKTVEELAELKAFAIPNTDIEDVSWESENKDVSLQGENINEDGKRPEQDNGGGIGTEGTDARRRVASDATRGMATNRDRGYIRVYEQGLAASRGEHSNDRERDRREAESERLVGIAREQGQYFDKERQSGLGDRQSGRSGESEVYINKEARRVYKVKDPYAKSPMKGNVQVEDAIYEHLVHNKYFPETAYGFEGISDDNGDLRVVLSQDYVEATRQATKEEIEAALAQKGLLPEGNYRYGNDEVSVTDVTGDNALMGADGNVYFIDPIIDFKRPVREILEEVGETGSLEVGEEAQAQAGGMSSQETALQRIPRDEKGEPIFEQAETPELGWDALVEFRRGDTKKAQGIADGMVKNAKDAHDKAQKLKPKGKTVMEMSESQDRIEAQQAQAAAIYDYWQRVAAVQQHREAEARAQAEAAEAERKAREEAIARKERELDEMLSDLSEPLDAREAIAMSLLGMIRRSGGERIGITPESWRNEMGGLSEERRGLMPGMIRKKENGGISISQLANKIKEGDTSGFLHNMEDQDIRDELIDLLLSESNGGLREYIMDRRRRLLEREREAERSALESEYQQAYHMSVDEYEAYIDEQARELELRNKDFDISEYNGILADEYEKYRYEHDTTGKSETDGRGGEILHSQGSAERGGEADGVGREPRGEVADRLPGDIEAAAMGESPAGAEPSDRGTGVADDSTAAGGRGDVQPIDEQQSDLSQGKSEEITYQLSDEVDEDGSPFVLSSNGNTDFGVIPQESGLISAPIKLSLGNSKYGLIHLVKRHGDEIRKAGFESVESFVEYVAKNFSLIREGENSMGEANGTYLLQLEDEHNNTLYVELSTDGSYWGVNSGGVFRKGYGKNKKEVWSASEEQNKQSATDNTLRTGDYTDNPAAPNGTVSNASNDKDTTLSSDKQILGEESSLQSPENEVTPTIQGAVETASAEVNTEPTPAQAEAGNYKNGHVTIGDFDITIENPAGSVRKGVDADGKEWETTMHNTYGYIKGTEGVDGDHIDVFLGENMDEWNGRQVYVVDQYNPDGTFDEHKVMLGFNDKNDAYGDYLANYESGWEKGRKIVVTAANIEDFEKWIASSHHKTKPFAEYAYVSKKAETTTEATKGEGYIIEQRKHTKNNTDIFAVKFERKVSKEEFAGQKAIAKKHGGYWSNFGKKGFLFKSEADAKAFAKEVMGKSEDEIADEAPLSMEDMRPDDEAESPRVETRGTVADEAQAGGISSQGDTVVEKNGFKVGEQVWYTRNDGKGKRELATIVDFGGGADVTLDTGGAPVMYEACKWSQIEKREPEEADRLIGWDEPGPDENPFMNVDATSAEEKPTSKKRKWISDEDAAEFDDLRSNLRSHLGAEGDIAQEPEEEYGHKKSPQGARQDLTTSSLQQVDDAKLRKISENLRALAQKFSGKTDKRGVFTDLANAVGAKKRTPNSSSDYVRLVLPNMATVELCISNHNANASTFAQNGNYEGNISIVIKSGRSRNTFRAHPEVELTEYVYTTEAIKADGMLLSQVAESLRSMIETGEYVDLSGKAIVNHSPTESDIVREDEPSYGKPQPKQMDAEVLRMGTRMTYLMMKGGLRKFSDYAEAMVDEVGDAIRPHLKSLYAAAQNMEEVMELGWDEEMDDRKAVKAFDVYNFDKPGAKDIIETAQHVTQEEASQQQTEQIVQSLKDQRNEQRKQEADKTSADTEIVASQAEATASEVESELADARTEEDAERLNESLDKEIEEVNNQLALLGYYEADQVDKDFNEAYGYMRNAERKATQDAHRLATQLAADLGITLPTKDKVKKGKHHGFGSSVAQSNLAPAGGEIHIKLPLGGGRELSVVLYMEPNAKWLANGRADRPADDLVFNGGYFRVENPNGKGFNERYLTSNNEISDKVTYDELLADIRRATRHLLPTEVLKPSEPLTRQPGEDLVDMAERVTKDRQPKELAVKPEQSMGDLFGGLFDEPKSETDKVIVDAVEKDKPAAPKPKPAKKLSGDSAEYQAQDIKERDFVNDLRVEMVERITSPSGTPLTMAEVRKMAKECGITDISATDLQELVERAISLNARTIAEQALAQGKIDPKEAYDRIVRLYEMQPNLTDRDSERVAKQQYSTPVPMGYVMNQFMLSKGFKGKSLLEPSAGNGALTIGVPMAMCHVNDIDARRLANLRGMGFPLVTNQDGTLAFKGEYDMVVTNPPFGKMTPKQYGPFSIETLEGQMAINALESLKDNGRAAIIIGGAIGKWPTPYRENGSLERLADRQFFGYLYSYFNVVDIIPIDGKKLYSRNGTGYNVRMILIDGRRRDAEGNVIREVTADNRVYPPVMAEARPEPVTTYEELYNRVQDDISRISQRVADALPSDGGGRESEPRNTAPDTGRTDSPRGGRVQQSMGDNEHGRTRGQSVGRPSASANTDRSGRVGSTASPTERPAEHRGDAYRAPMAEGRGSNSGERNGGAANADGPVVGSEADRVGQRSRSGNQRLTPPEQPVKVTLTDEKVASPHISEANHLMSRMPAAQAMEFDAALKGLEARHGNIDEWLVDELGYANTSDLWRALAAEQVEGVAMAIDKMESERGFIIADQTGIGKGRQAASIIRYAIRQGRKPIFFTQKPGLFSDMYRDLCDIGSTELRPFIFGSDNDANITVRDKYGNDVTVFKRPTKAEINRVFSYVEQNGELPPEYDYAVITYSQISTGTVEYDMAASDEYGKPKQKIKSYKGAVPATAKAGQRRRNIVERLAEDNYIILDESHTAGGQSGTGGFMQTIISGVRGVTYLSATYAKRPDNMPLYAIKTAISESGVSTNELIGAVSKGGVPLQEIMSRQLVKSGEMVRRERDFTGVSIDWVETDTGRAEEQRQRFDVVSQIFADIMRFQDQFVTPAIKDISKDQAALGGIAGLKKGTKAMGVDNVPFASKLYNMIQQLLFSIKVDAIADRAIRNLEAGRKPIISFVNTMEGYLELAQEEYAEGKKEMPTLALSLQKALDGVMRYTIKDADNKETHSTLDLYDMAPGAVEAYNAIMAKIRAVSEDLPIAPLDAIRMKIEEAGFTVRELSGRTLELAKDKDGLCIIRKRGAADKKAAAADFNDGSVDVLLINKTGSTGISLHASERFGDKRQRVMIAAQFQPDVNDEVQMRGRIDRTGQVLRGAYEYLMSCIPAEQRLQMMFKAKLKSLDANTTSSQKSSFNEMEIVDVLNKYGDEIVYDYLMEELALNADMGNPLDLDEKEQHRESNGDNTPKKEGGAPEGFARKALGRLALLNIQEQERVMSEISDRYLKKIKELDERGENDLEITSQDLKAKTLSKDVWVEGTDPDGDNAFADNVYCEQVEVNILAKPMKLEEVKGFHKTMLDEAGVSTWEEFVSKKRDEINAHYDGKIAEVTERVNTNTQQTIERRRKKMTGDLTTARANGKNSYTDEQIRQLVEEKVGPEELQAAQERIEREKSRLNFQRKMMIDRMERFKAMQPIAIPENLTDENRMSLEPSMGVLVGIKFDKKFSLSGTQAIFAPLDGRRSVSITFKEATTAFGLIGHSTLMIRDMLSNFDIERDWNNSISKDTREVRYMLTGNILRALVDSQKTEKARGRIMTYTTEDGEVKTGILMPPKFEPGDLQSETPISNMADAIRKGVEAKSSNGEVIVRRSQGWRAEGPYELLVPKSKAKGGKYYLDDRKLLSLVVSTFDLPRSGNNAVAYISEQNLDKVLKHLSTFHKISVMQQSKLGVSKESGNFAKEPISRYETEEGQEIRYTSEHPEGYGGLFDFDFSGENAGGHEDDSRAGANGVWLEDNPERREPGSGLNRAAGEFALVERVFKETGRFSFTSGERIESADDVAFIFSALEDAAKEHTFVVYVKDGKPTVVELGMGSFNASIADTPTASLAYQRILPDEVYFVHNHPSGNLKCSPQDAQLLRKMQDMCDVPVHGVIINLKTGKYGTFDTRGKSGEGVKRVPANENALTVHTLDKQIFAPGYDPMSQPLVRGSQDVAAFLNSHRMGDRAKVSFLILSQGGRIVGNIHTPFTEITTGVRDKARYISEKVVQFGGATAILYGDFGMSTTRGTGFRMLAEQMEKVGGTRLLDVVEVEGNHTRSANDDGLLYEPESDYGASDGGELRFRAAMTHTPVEFDEQVQQAVEQNGIVTPGLVGGVVPVIKVGRHQFNRARPIAEARAWAKSHIVGEHILTDSAGASVPYTISGRTVEKYLSSSSISKSENLGVHLAVLQQLPEIIGSSIEAEVHPDYIKGEDGVRRPENGYNPGVLVHRFYGAVEIDGNLYRVKTTVIENGREQKNKPHSFEVSAVELMEEPSISRTIMDASNVPASLVNDSKKSHIYKASTVGLTEETAGQHRKERAVSTFPRYSESSLKPSPTDQTVRISTAKLLKGVEKSYDPGKKLLDESRMADADAMRGHGAELATRLHTSVRFIDDVGEISDSDKKVERKKRSAKGWYDTATGEVVIVLPNCENVADVEATIFHEIVGHKGMRDIIGEKSFGQFLREVYDHASKTTRANINALIAKNGWDVELATEEYIAQLAEKGFEEMEAQEQSFWAKVKARVLDFLKRLFEGRKLPKSVSIGDNEIRYMLWRAYQQRTDSTLVGEAENVVMQKRLGVGEVRYSSEISNVEIMNRRFNDELKEQITGKLETGHIYQLGMPGEILRTAGFPAIPIEMSSTRLHEKSQQENHKFELSDVVDLVKALNAPVAVFHYGNSAMNVIVDVEKGGKHFLVGVHFKQSREGVEVSSVRGIFPKDNAEWLNWISQGKATYLNKEKIQTLINQQRINLADVEYLDLDDVAKVLKNFENTTINSEESSERYRFRSGNYTNAREEYEDRVRTIDERDKRTGEFREDSQGNKKRANRAAMWHEAYFDSMASLKALQEAVANETGDPIEHFENAYWAENRMSSSNQAQIDAWKGRYYEPLMTEVAALSGRDMDGYKNLLDYMMAKHGLERNEYMRARADANGEETERDFAGLTALFDLMPQQWEEAEQRAQDLVAAYESAHRTARLWQMVNAATKATLQKRYESGLISKDVYDRISTQYDYYLPLKGWADTVAGDVYEYAAGTYHLGSALHMAFGRESMADDPIATLAVDAERTIMEANRNLMKQAFLNMAINHPTSLLTVSRQWYVRQADGSWMEANPQIPADASADMVNSIVEQFNTQMETLAQNGDAVRRRQGLQLEMRTDRYEQPQHMVTVRRAGETYNIFINGNPRAALALNGMLNPDTGETTRLKRWGQNIKNFMSRAFTTWNPEFIVGNLSRDVMFAGTAVAIKEDGRYNRQYAKNITSILAKGKLIGLLRKYKAGSLDMSIDIERYFYEFLTNGGETGFTQLNTVDKVKKDMERFIRQAQGGASTIPGKAWRGLLNGVEFMNRCAEDTTRFAVYMTSRQVGRSVAESVWNAKEITVNFNKKGSGALGARYMNFLYVFFNAAMQALGNAGRLIKNHPVKSTIAMVAFMSSGFLLPVLAQAMCGLFGGAPDDYFKLPEWVRRNNLVFYVPFTNKFITIPIAHELRPFYGIGELAYSTLMGEEDAEDAILKGLEGFTGILPVDWTGNGGNVWVSLTPTIAQPITQAAANVDYFGKPIYKQTAFNTEDPEWEKAYRSTHPAFVEASKWLYEATANTNEAGRLVGGIDINPAISQHLIESYTGGMGKAISKTSRTISALWDEDARELRNVPIVSKFLQNVDERAVERRDNNKYFDFREEYEDLQRDYRYVNEQPLDSITGHADKLSEWLDKPAGRRFLILRDYMKDIDYWHRVAKNAPTERMKEQADSMGKDVMSQMIETMKAPEAYPDSVIERRIKELDRERRHQEHKVDRQMRRAERRMRDNSNS